MHASFAFRDADGFDLRVGCVRLSDAKASSVHDHVYAAKPYDSYALYGRGSSKQVPRTD